MYSQVPKVPDFPAMERRILELWERTGAFAKLRARNAGNPPWSFLDGPITANNPMGIHHAWGRGLKDMFQRYHAMNGKDLRYQNGFDCQGLWVEVEVEKELGFETKADIQGYGIDRFVRDCKKRVLTYAARIVEQSIRLGYWTDWDDPATLRALCDALDHGGEVAVTVPSGKKVRGPAEEIVGRLGCEEYGGSYFTLADENNYTIWAFLKKCHDEGFLYQGTDVLPWCCRCGTGLSQMEVAEGRKATTHTAVFVRFPLRERADEALLAWTTTPWTLTSNVAAAVNPRHTYLKVRAGDWVYYVGKGNYERDRSKSEDDAESGVKLCSLPQILKATGRLEVLGELLGSELLGLEYDGPFDHLPAQQRRSEDGKVAVECHRVIGWNEVTESEGTGIVHIAPGCGAEDHQLGQENDLATLAPLAESGEYLEGFGDFDGRHVLTVADDVVHDLERRGILVAQETYPHVYPHCWRCKEELVFRLVDEWFIRMDWRERIQKTVKDVRWVPAEGEAWELDWLRNMGDWMISKKRFWGLALPIWVCGDCGRFTVVSGKDELRQRAVEGWDEFEGHTPHRPWIDAVKLSCDDCGGLMSRTPDVGTPWLDAGIVPFSTMHFERDHEYWEKWFPADLVLECFPGQFRNWFYSLLAMSAMMDGRAPFKALLGHALVRDARGQEMHKSAGNSIDFDEAAEKLGADMVRYIYARQNSVHNVNFPDLDGGEGRDTELATKLRRKLLTLWNSYSFFITYAAADDWRPRGQAAELADLDRWILSRVQSLIATAHRSFQDLVPFRFVHAFEELIDEVSNWYIRRSRRRFWKAGSDADKEAAFKTLHTVLVTLLRLLAPVLPFFTEEMYQNLVCTADPEAPESIHLTPYPTVDEALVDVDLEAKIDCVVQVKNLGLGLRTRSGIKTRQPLQRLLVAPEDAAARAVLAEERFARQVLDECNVKEIELIDGEAAISTTRVQANRRSLGKKHGKKLPRIEARLVGLDGEELSKTLAQDGSYELDVDGTSIAVDEEDVIFVQETPEHLITATGQGFFAALDTTISPELAEEGLARDFNRHAQEERRRSGLLVSDRIRLEYACSDELAAALARHHEYLQKELLAEEIERAESLGDGKTVRLGGEDVGLLVRKV